MYRETVRGIIPMKIQTAIREHCPTIDESGEKMTGFPPCTLPGVTATEVTDVFNSIRACPRIVETLTYHVSAVDVAVYLFNAQISSLSDILARLERR